MPLFQNTVLQKYLQSADQTRITAAYERFKAHFHNPEIQENIRTSKEEQYQSEFLIDLFVTVLGYVKNPQPGFNLATEYKNDKYRTSKIYFMKTLRIGDTGNDVQQWQFFLTGQNLYAGVVDGIFGQGTKAASIAFQKQHNLQPDGIVGNKTIGIAMSLGLGVLVDDREGKMGANWPPEPNFPPLITNVQRANIFGRFEYKHKPLPGNPENIEVLGNWANVNIVRVNIPQLSRIKGSPTVYFHRYAANQLMQLWDDWENAGLLHLVLTWEGTYAPRFVRGSNKTLSNHAFGSAFDINYEWNKLGTVPALVGQKGSVRELVGIANDNGFYWGGHFSRSDGMHFEVAFLK